MAVSGRLSNADRRRVYGLRCRSALRKRARKLIACLLLIECTNAVGAIEDRNWSRYRSEHFVVYSDLPERRVAASIDRLEMFRAAVHTVTRTEGRKTWAHPTDLLLLARSADIKRLFGLDDVAGFMRPGLRSNLLVATRLRGDARYRAGDEVAFHEYVHYLIRNASAHRYPAWYDEGLAETLSTIHADDGRIIVGTEPQRIARTRRANKTMALADLLDVRQPTELAAERRAAFYARAWLLTHYVLLSPTGRERGYPAALSRYMSLVNAGRARARAFEQAFGLSPPDMDQEINRYSESGVATYALSLDRVRYDGRYEKTVLTTGAIAYVLGQHATSDNPEAAARLFRRVLESSPEHARALSGLGVTLRTQGRYDEAAELMRRAVALAPDDYVPLVELADLLISRCQDATPSGRCDNASSTDEADRYYRRAYDLAPGSFEVMARYGQALLAAGQYQQALPVLRDALAFSPSSYQINRNLGIAALGAGDAELAKALIERVYGWAEDSPAEQRRLKSLLSRVEAILSDTREADALDPRAHRSDPPDNQAPARTPDRP